MRTGDTTRYINSGDIYNNPKIYTCAPLSCVQLTVSNSSRPSLCYLQKIHSLFIKSGGDCNQNKSRPANAVQTHCPNPVITALAAGLDFALSAGRLAEGPRPWPVPILAALLRWDEERNAWEMSQ